MIYLVKAAGRYKIGTAADPERRLAEMQTGSPVRLFLLATGPGGHEREAQIHLAYASKRRHGEWFALTSRERTEVAKIVRGEAECGALGNRGRLQAAQVRRKKARVERERAAGVRPRDGQRVASRVKRSQVAPLGTSACGHCGLALLPGEPARRTPGEACYPKGAKWCHPACADLLGQANR